MKNLDELISRFNPRRTFNCSHSTVEVDGVFVRVPMEDEKDSWVPSRVNAKADSNTHYLIKIEDLLQDPGLIRSARVSTGRDSKAVNEKAQGLVNFLWRDNHVTPSEGSIIIRSKWTTPIMYAQPIFRLFGAHNEFSGRYSVIDGEYYTPDFTGYRDEALLRQEFTDAEQEARELYQKLLDMGVAKEMARYVHLYRFYTKFYFTSSLRHLLEFLRIDENTNDRHSTTEFWEIKDPLRDIVRNWTPWASEAFDEHPKPLNFDWVRLCKLSPFDLEYRLLSNTGERILDHGYLELINSNIDENIIRVALNDFPDPTKALDHGSMTFFVRMPIHVFRQWVRHRSLRFSEQEINFDQIVDNNRFYLPDRFRKQTGKVGNYTFTDMSDGDNETIRNMLVAHIESCKVRYNRLRGHGLSIQMASMNLPYMFYIDTLLTTPLGGLANFFSLRTDSHAQKEIKEYAFPMWRIFAHQSPFLAEIFARNMYYGDSKEVRGFNQ